MSGGQSDLEQPSLLFLSLGFRTFSKTRGQTAPVFDRRSKSVGILASCEKECRKTIAHFHVEEKRNAMLPLTCLAL